MHHYQHETDIWLSPCLLKRAQVGMLQVYLLGGLGPGGQRILVSLLSQLSNCPFAGCLLREEISQLLDHEHVSQRRLHPQLWQRLLEQFSATNAAREDHA